MAPSGSTFRYTKLQAIYRADTIPTPNASDRGRLRLGLRTSAAVKVTLFQASDEKSAPTMATPTSRTALKFQPAFRQNPVKLVCTASVLRPSRKPNAISPSSAAVL